MKHDAITVAEYVPGERFPTQWGWINFLEWLTHEKVRMKQHGKNTEIIFDDLGRVKLCHCSPKEN